MSPTYDRVMLARHFGHLDVDSETDDLPFLTYLLESGGKLTPALHEAIFRGTSIGGARPKALIDGPDGLAFIAKFSSTTDTYPRLADEIRARFTDPTATMEELFRRIVFNVIIGNIDDHARNHAAFNRLLKGAILNPSIFYRD